MRKTVLDKLNEIEQKYNVTILYAVESGSRAWGFASPDSDYDVRFIYKRKVSDYLKLEKQRDVIEYMSDDGLLDFAGWDLDKTLKLVYASNPSLIEWANTTLIYKETPDFQLIKKQIIQYMDKKKCMLHYIHMASNNYETYLKKDYVNMKKYFYALRPIFAAKWLKEHDGLIPLEFTTLLENECPLDYKNDIYKMLEIKKENVESSQYPINTKLNNFIKETLNDLEGYAKELNTINKDFQELDDLFLNLINN